MTCLQSHHIIISSQYDINSYSVQNDFIQDTDSLAVNTGLVFMGWHLSPLLLLKGWQQEFPHCLHSSRVDSYAFGFLG